MLLKDFLKNPSNDNELTRAIVNNINEPLLILDENMHVVMASPSFYFKFQVEQGETRDKDIRKLGDGQWDIPSFRNLLEKIIPQHKVVQGYEITHEFPHIGNRVMLLNAQEIWFESVQQKNILISIFDITERRNLEESNELIHQKDLLMKEMQHRMGNNLQLISSILWLKGESIESQELKSHLSDTHNRIMSIVEIQKHLELSGLKEHVEIRGYLNDLCNGIARSMIDNNGKISLLVESETQTIVAAKALLVGLITTELVINALKHAFVGRKEGQITVSYKKIGDGWNLNVSDNGVGMSEKIINDGVGIDIIATFVRQLNAVIDVKSDNNGTIVSIEGEKKLPV